MKKYPKEFILLLSNWLRGTETNKSLFKNYENIINQNIIKNDFSYRIWDFEEKDLTNLMKNGLIKLDKEYIESSFKTIDNNFNDFDLVEKISEKLTPYISDFKLITKRYGNLFNPYEPLEYTLNNKRLISDYNDKEIDIINKRLNRYKYQNEFFLIEPEEFLRLNEVQFFLISNHFLNKNHIDKNHIIKYQHYENFKNYTILDKNKFHTLCKEFNLCFFKNNNNYIDIIL